jgi:hypothetical protein
MGLRFGSEFRSYLVGQCPSFVIQGVLSWAVAIVWLQHIPIYFGSGTVRTLPWGVRKQHNDGGYECESSKEKAIKVRFRYALAWIAFVARFCIGGVVVSLLSLLIGEMLGQLSAGEPLSWPEWDAVLSMGKLGVIYGFITGTGIFLINAIEERKHRIQEPKRSWRWWRSNHD